MRRADFLIALLVCGGFETFAAPLTTKAIHAVTGQNELFRLLLAPVSASCQVRNSETPLQKLNKAMKRSGRFSGSEFSCNELMQYYDHAVSIGEEQSYPNFYQEVELGKNGSKLDQARYEFERILGQYGELGAAFDSYDDPVRLPKRYGYLLDSLFEERPSEFTGTMLYNFLDNLPQYLSVEQKKIVIDLVAVFLYAKTMDEMDGSQKPDYKVLADLRDENSWVNFEPTKKTMEASERKNEEVKAVLAEFRSQEARTFCMGEIYPSFRRFQSLCENEAEVAIEFITGQFSKISSGINDSTFEVEDATKCNQVIDSLYSVVFEDPKVKRLAMKILGDHNAVLKNTSGHYAGKWNQVLLENVDRDLSKLPKHFRNELPPFGIVRYAETPGLSEAWYYVTLNFVGYIGSVSSSTLLHETTHVWDYRSEVADEKFDDEWRKVCGYQRVDIKDSLGISSSPRQIMYTSKRQCTRYAQCSGGECLAESVALLLVDPSKMEPVSDSIKEFLQDKVLRK